MGCNAAIYSKLTCAGADTEGLLFIPTKDAVCDAPPGAIWILRLCLCHCSTWGSEQIEVQCCSD